MKVDGQSIEVLNERQGWLGAEAGWWHGESAMFDGWCKDAARNQPAVALLIFVNNQLVHKSVPSVAVPPLEDRFPAGTHAGFNLSLPRGWVANQKVRVFALLSGNRAGELAYPPSYPYEH
jgi:hypothetical protein